MAISPITGGAGQSQAEKSGFSFGNNVENFLKLLVTQLNNQDPTDPLDTNAVTEQIASLAQVEQAISTNKNLEQLLTAMIATQYNNAVSYIGKGIEAPGNAGWMKNGEGLFTYYLADNADKAKITIKNQAGSVVYEGATHTKIGRNEFTWDGKSSSGQAMPAGIYTFEIEAQDANNVPVTAQAFTSGIVKSLDNVNGKVYLTIGDDLSVPIENVSSIHAPSEIS
jgi:flagellar basal-body rod modification protein FlgD